MQFIARSKFVAQGSVKLILEKNMIRFTPNPTKALEAILWVATKHATPTAFTISKILFFADKKHLEQYGRPIIGDTYIAMNNGPVPSLVYNIIKMDGYQLDDDTLTKTLEAFTVEETPHPTVIPNRDADDSLFSNSDIECLEAIMDEYGTASVTKLYEVSHDNRAWHDANLNAPMDYELIVDETLPDREELIEDLKESASHMVF